MDTHNDPEPHPELPELPQANLLEQSPDLLALLDLLPEHLIHLTLSKVGFPCWVHGSLLGACDQDALCSLHRRHVQYGSEGGVSVFPLVWVYVRAHTLHGCI